jgi:hypothetical protein
MLTPSTSQEATLDRLFFSFLPLRLGIDILWVVLVGGTVSVLLL